MNAAALLSCSVSPTNECPRIKLKCPRAKERPRNTMNPALNQEFHLFCEQEQLQKHPTLMKNHTVRIRHPQPLWDWTTRLSPDWTVGNFVPFHHFLFFSLKKKTSERDKGRDREVHKKKEIYS